MGILRQFRLTLASPGAAPGILAPQRDHADGRERLMDRSGHDGASDEEHCQDGGKTSNDEEGVQGSHDRHSRVRRGTLYGKRTAAAIFAFLRAYTYPVEKLDAA